MSADYPNRFNTWRGGWINVVVHRHIKHTTLRIYNRKSFHSNLKPNSRRHLPYQYQPCIHNCTFNVIKEIALFIRENKSHFLFP